MNEVKDRIVEYPRRFKLQAVDGQADTYDLIAQQGAVTEAGTPLNKALFDSIKNDIDAMQWYNSLGITMQSVSSDYSNYVVTLNINPSNAKEYHDTYKGLCPLNIYQVTDPKSISSGFRPNVSYEIKLTWNDEKGTMPMQNQLIGLKLYYSYIDSDEILQIPTPLLTLSSLSSGNPVTFPQKISGSILNRNCQFRLEGVLRITE